MPQKKPKPSKRVPIYIRLNAEEAIPVEADRKSMPGIQPTLGGYAKHAVMSYPALRLLEQNVRAWLTQSDKDFPGASKLALELLETSGLDVRL